MEKTAAQLEAWRSTPLDGLDLVALVLVKGFRRLKGRADMPTLVAALRARDRQLGLVASSEEGQKIA